MQKDAKRWREIEKKSKTGNDGFIFISNSKELVVPQIKKVEYQGVCLVFLIKDSLKEIRVVYLKIFYGI